MLALFSYYKYNFNNLENDPKFHLTFCLIDTIHPIISSYLYQLEIPVRPGAKHIVLAVLTISYLTYTNLVAHLEI